MARLSRRDLVLLALLTLFWGVNWPVMKLGVADLPPLYFRSLCIGGGLVFIWAYARATKVPLTVPPGAWPSIVKLAIPNVIVWHLLAIYAVKMLASGRAAILGYTMPVWAVVFGLLLFKERPLRRHWVGVIAAFIGTLLLLSSEFTKLAGSPLGTLLMLTAAASWGFGTHLMRRYLTAMPTISLTFWMLTLTVSATATVSLLTEFEQWRMPGRLEWFAIVYNMAIAIAFCHVVWSMLARNLPPAASGLSVMMIPVLGVFSGMLVLGEQPHWQDYAALVLILLALSTVLLPSRSTS
ncbi:MAG TPA: EamA family transporter [Burkholderiaceae bacterium]|nr:EamA family transporter [Burkholderiaceae bacterium]